MIILISGQNPKLAGRREGSEDFLCSILYFFSIRHRQKKSWKHKEGGKTYGLWKEETKKARKTTRLRKGNCVGVSDRQGSLREAAEDLRLHVAEILRSIELTPQTWRSCKEEINCWAIQSAEKGYRPVGWFLPGWVLFRLKRTFNVKLTVIAEDFPVEVDGGVAQYNSLLQCPSPQE